MKTFFQTTANPQSVLPGLIDLAKLLRDGGVTKLYIYGLCWGGKMATLSGCQSINVDGKSIPAFNAVAGLHPA
jgi:dienelactone hydrolase